MARQQLAVNVNPNVMRWARESAGFSWADVSKKTNISAATVQEWERGTKKPTLNTLERLASSYRRPLAVFFLPQPPEEPSMPSDFRALPSERRRPLSAKALLGIRRARYVQSIATELFEMEGLLTEPIAEVGKVSLEDTPESAATRERQRLGITIRDQFRFRSSYQAFGMWRDALESLNILVHQARIAVDEVRGFSLLDGMVPTIVVSFSDSINGKIFTLFHEYAHIILGRSGICIPVEASGEEADKQAIEKYCNDFAGVFLVPSEHLRNDENARAIVNQSAISDWDLNTIAQRFRVSTHVVLRRLLTCGLISRRRYFDKRKELEETGLARLQEKEKKKKGERPFKMAASKRCVLENGRFFVSLALDAAAKDRITSSDLADYLSIDLKHVDKVEALVS